MNIIKLTKNRVYDKGRLNKNIKAFLCSYIILFLRDHGVLMYVDLEMEFRSCARGRQWCGIIHYYW